MVGEREWETGREEGVREGEGREGRVGREREGEGKGAGVLACY